MIRRFLTDLRSGRRASARISRALRKAVSPEVMERITTPAKAYPRGKLTRPDPPRASTRNTALSSIREAGLVAALKKQKNGPTDGTVLLSFAFYSASLSSMSLMT